MSVNHTGNVQPQIDNEEHEHYLDPPTKRVLNYGFDGTNKHVLKTDEEGNLKSLATVTMGSAGATIYAVVNTSESSSRATVNLNTGAAWVGLATVVSGATVYAVVNTSESSSRATVVLDTGAAWIGLATTVIGAGTQQIGAVTIPHVVNALATITSGATIFAVVNTTASSGLATVNLNTGGAWVGLATTVIGAGTAQMGSVTVSNIVNSLATSVLAPGTSQVGSVTISHVVNALATVTSGATIFAVVNTTEASGLATVNLNTGAAWVGLATTVVGAGTAQMGSVTVSNTVNSLATSVLAAGTAQIGSVTVSNIINSLATVTFSGNATVINAAGSAWIGLATTVLGAGTAQIGSVTVSNIINSLATVTFSGNATVINGAGTAWIGLATTAIGAGTAQMGSVTVSNVINSLSTVTFGDAGATIFAVVNTTEASGLATVNLNTGAAWVGLATTVIGAGTAWMGLATVVNGASSAYIGLATVNIGVGTSWIGLATVSLGAGTAQIGSVTVSSIGPGTATIGIISGNVNIIGSGKTWYTKNIALTAANTSGSTVFVCAASKRYFITQFMLSTASIIGISILNGATYLVGNASVRLQFAPQSGVVRSGSPEAPVWKSLADETNFLIATDTAAPLAGDITWYEE